MKKTLVLALALSLTPSLFAQNWSKDLEKQAKKGDVSAQYQVGVSYLKGSGVDADAKKAAKFLSMAASQGHEEAKEQFFSFYSKELEKLAKSGDEDAQYALGKVFFEGKGCDKDTEIAAEWFGMAAVQGHAEATEELFSYKSAKRDELSVTSLVYKDQMIGVEAYHVGLSRFDIRENMYTKDPYCEIYFLKGDTEEVRVFGERNENVVSGGLVFLNTHVYFEGDITIHYGSFCLHKGGSFFHLDYEGSHELTEDYLITTDQIDRSYFDIPETPKISFTKKMQIPADQKAAKWDELVSLFLGADYESFHGHDRYFLEGVKNHSGLSELEYTSEYTLSSAKHKKMNCGTYLKEGIADSVFLGNGRYLKWKPDPKSLCSTMTYHDNNGDSVSITQGWCSYKRTLDDCVIQKGVGIDPKILFKNGDSYVGTFDIKAYPIELNLLRAKNSKELKISYYTGVFTDKSGKKSEYVEGMTKAEWEKKRQAEFEKLKKKVAETVEALKERCGEIKRILVNEGYNPQHVKDLIDNCRIYPGMSAFMIERAIQMQGNVFGSITVNATVWDEQKIITIYDMKTLQIVFQQVVEYNNVTKTVQRVGSSF